MKTKNKMTPMQRAFREQMRIAATSWRTEADKKYWLGIAVNYRELSKQ